MLKPNQPVRLLSQNDVKSLGLSFEEFIALVEQAYILDARGLAEVPSKIGVHPDFPNSFMHAMPAWVGETRALGMKWVSYYPGNFERGLADSTAVITLNDPDHGHVVAFMEALYITFLRTAACATVAAKHLLKSAPRTLTLVGCGGLGLWTLRLMNAAFPTLTTTYVSSKTSASRNKFCQEMSVEVGHDVVPVDDLADALSHSDIVVSSLPPSEERPVVGGLMPPGSVYIPLDISHAWEDSVITEASAVISDNPTYFADMIKNKRPGIRVPEVLSLQETVAGRNRKEDAAHGTVVVGVAGIASTDVVIGWEVYRRAVDRNVGTLFQMV